MLLSGNPIFCPQCYLKITVDREGSKETLDAVHELDSALKRAEQMKRDAQPGGGT